MIWAVLSLALVLPLITWAISRWFFGRGKP